MCHLFHDSPGPSVPVSLGGWESFHLLPLLYSSPAHPFTTSLSRPHQYWTDGLWLQDQSRLTSFLLNGKRTSILILINIVAQLFFCSSFLLLHFIYVLFNHYIYNFSALAIDFFFPADGEIQTSFNVFKLYISKETMLRVVEPCCNSISLKAACLITEDKPASFLSSIRFHINWTITHVVSHKKKEASTSKTQGDFYCGLSFSFSPCLLKEKKENPQMKESFSAWAFFFSCMKDWLIGKMLLLSKSISS